MLTIRNRDSPMKSEKSRKFVSRNSFLFDSPPHQIFSLILIEFARGTDNSSSSSTVFTHEPITHSYTAWHHFQSALAQPARLPTKSSVPIPSMPTCSSANNAGLAPRICRYRRHRSQSQIQTQGRRSGRAGPEDGAQTCVCGRPG